MALFHRLGQPCCRARLKYVFIPRAVCDVLAHMVASSSAERQLCADIRATWDPQGCPSHRFDRFEAARARTASLGGCPHHFDTCPTGTPPRRRDA